MGMSQMPGLRYVAIENLDSFQVKGLYDSETYPMRKT
jgi:hypothetical protein